jgi:hypothetical protein
MVAHLHIPVGRLAVWSTAAIRLAHSSQRHPALLPLSAWLSLRPGRREQTRTAVNAEAAEGAWPADASGRWAADPASALAYSALLVAADPTLRMPGPERFDPTRGDWCVCAVPLLWTADQGWVHMEDGRPCLLPRRTRR